MAKSKKSASNLSPKLNELNIRVRHLEILVDSTEYQDRLGNLSNGGHSYLNGLKTALKIIKGHNIG